MCCMRKLGAWIWLLAALCGHVESRAGDARHWSFIAPVRPSLPEVKNAQWARHPIDRFILRRLEEAQITPSAAADKVTLLRRIHLDLTGLPPSPKEVAAFLADARPEAYAQAVDRLLASPHYGERWGRWWLDAARYADSNGYSIDAPRQIWRYRDWVINTLNRDMPFDQFTIEQIAGDMLPNATMEQKIATGFHRNTQINQEGGIDTEQFRIESIIDRINTTATTWLGLTLGCAQCHDHKFDPLTQRDFYQFFALLNNADEPNLPLNTPEETERAAKVDAAVAAYVRTLSEKMPALFEKAHDWERSLTPEASQKQSQEVRTVFSVPHAARTLEQKFVTLTAFIETTPENKPHQDALKKIRAAKPEVQTTMVMRTRATPRRTYLFVKGDFTRDGGDIPSGVPAILHPIKKPAPNRLDLAHWLVARDNPLTARVIVNRVWQQYFGKGLVETENDFGTQGTRPSHPELLDWLAMEFMQPTAPGATPWSLKHLHRLILSSETYRQSSRMRPELNLRDANNYLLARQNRLRLDAELVRDVCLATSGLLSPKMGGPSVHPPIPDGVMALGQVKRAWPVSTGEDRYRRGLYTFYFRATPHPALNLFDAPDGYSVCTRRARSNTPLQALTLLNDTAFVEMAASFARRILTESGATTDEGRLHYAFGLCTARKPAATELAVLGQLLSKQKADYAVDAKLAEKLVGTQSSKPLPPTELAPWVVVARVLLNLDEVITRE